jgi:hypothetical protein
MRTIQGACAPDPGKCGQVYSPGVAAFAGFAPAHNRAEALMAREEIHRFMSATTAQRAASMKRDADASPRVYWRVW